jgi:phosphopantothenoylcysteine decarboxylase/phosphopantothenate--cysteine ligase
MNFISNKHVVVGITGGIAAYKSADLTRRLLEAGAEVRVVMTTAATEFVTPLTFQALSGYPVFFDNNEDSKSTAESSSTSAGMKHIELARWADVIIIAPASANTLAKLAHGRADNLLTTLCLASEAIKCFAPAMNRVMWDDLSTQQNCATLLKKNWYQFGPGSGSQACGEIGEGRMLDVVDILSELQQCFISGELHDLNIIITAGPTYEAIDPVRFIGNRSSGKMGYAIAIAAQEAGANVTLVSGPSHLSAPASMNFISIESAEEMKQAVMSNISNTHIYISAAAVADYRVEEISPQKIKKSSDSLILKLIKNEDIISTVAHLPSAPYIVGFAAETENLIDNAKNKLFHKNIDMIIANDVSASENNQPDIGFNSDNNALHVFWQNRNKASQISGEQHFQLEKKSQLAKQLISLIATQYKISHPSQESV